MVTCYTMAISITLIKFVAAYIFVYIYVWQSNQPPADDDKWANAHQIEWDSIKSKCADVKWLFISAHDDRLGNANIT